MKDICKSYLIEINKNMNSLLFLYEGNKVNFDLCFKEQANIIDKNNQEMKIIVNKNKNNCNNIINNITVVNTNNTNSNVKNVN